MPWGLLGEQTLQCDRRDCLHASCCLQQPGARIRRTTKRTPRNS